MMILNLFCVLLVLIFALCIILPLIEYIKFRKNPVPLMSNHDIRFEKITPVFSHKVGNIERGV